MSYIMLHHALNRGELCAEALCDDFCFLIFSNYCCSLSQAHFTVAQWSACKLHNQGVPIISIFKMKNVCEYNDNKSPNVGVDSQLFKCHILYIQQRQWAVSSMIVVYRSLDVEYSEMLRIPILLYFMRLLKFSLYFITSNHDSIFLLIQAS